MFISSSKGTIKQFYISIVDMLREETKFKLYKMLNESHRKQEKKGGNGNKE